MRQIGIWLDFDGADIIQITNGEISTEHIPSNIEHFNLKGGSRSKTPYGPMEKTSESKLLERKKHQSKLYFERICKRVNNADELFIMGPAEAKIGLRKYIDETPSCPLEVLDTLTVDSITENQKIAKVKAFFSV